MITLFTLIVMLLNAAFDTPHERESRPDFAELCWNETTIWIEHASDTSFVCDAAGEILIEATID